MVFEHTHLTLLSEFSTSDATLRWTYWGDKPYDVPPLEMLGDYQLLSLLVIYATAEAGAPWLTTV